MVKCIVFLSFVVVSPFVYGQHLYGSLTYGVMGYKSNYAAIQNSYSSYIESMEPILANNNLTFTSIDANFSNNNLAGALTFQLGFGGDGLSFVFTAMQTNTEQERNVRWSNGFGRSFVWKENRRETLFDIGMFGTKRLDFYGTFGVNWNWTRMVSYYMYPDDTQTLSSEFAYNGVYKHYLVGLSFGAGMRYRFKNYLALEFRYLFSKAGIVNDQDEDFGLSDNSITKNPDFQYFPGDFTEPVGLTTGNQIVPYFNRQSATVSAIFYLNLENRKQKEGK